MQLETFLAKLGDDQRVHFNETLAVIDSHYKYDPVKFTNGTGSDQIINEPGSNEGSCKIFAFAKRHQLPKDLTLALFGDFYWIDVLENPTMQNHANIRNFIKYGWAGVEFVNQALTPRK